MASHDQSMSSSQSSITSTQSIKERILILANELLKICKTDPNNSALNSNNIPHQITSLKHLKSNLFVFFYENICSTELIDKKWPCKSQEDEIHNLQSVIDSLSLDVLHEDLSHLTAEAILGFGSNSKQDLVSLEYLLDIMRCIHEWITSRTEPSLNATQATSQINHPEEKPNPISLTEKKYMDIDKKIEETIQMTKMALSTKPSYENIDYEGDDIFKKYMQQKELEFSLSKCKRLVNEIEVIKSSSGNSSLDNSSNCSLANSMNDEMFNLAVNLNNLNNQEQKHVKFQIDSRNRSQSPNYNQNEIQPDHTRSKNRRKIAQVKSSQSIQTVNNELEQIRSSLNKNLSSESNKIASLLKTVYSEDLKDAQALMNSNLTKLKTRSDLTNQLFLNAHSQDNNGRNLEKKRSSLTASASSRSKGVLLPKSKSLHSLGPHKRSSSMSSLNSARSLTSRSSSVARKQLILSKDPVDQFYSRFTIGEDGILNSLLQEFPYLYTAPETIHYLWQRHSKQIESLTKDQKELEQKYLNKMGERRFDDGPGTNRAEQHLKDANRKQEMLMDIMRKELEHLERQQDLKRKQLVENSMKSKTREQRFQNAKVKRYFEEFRMQQRGKMLKQKTSEELIFKKLFNESLKIQKERMLDLKKYAKEKNEINLNRQMNQIQSIENFYKNKFDLLNEQMKKEKESTQVREDAQHLLLTKMKSQVKSKLETDIRDLQDQMCRDKDFLYWRQLDADRVKTEVAKASYFKQPAK